MLRAIKIILKENASEVTAASIRKFVPGATEIFGVKNPLLNEIAAAYKDGGFDLVYELWNAGSYEEKTIAAKMIRKIAAKDPFKAIKTVEFFSKDIDNWAICDTLGMQSLKPINKKYGSEIFAMADRFSISTNMWIRRLSLVLVEDYCKDPSYHPAIKKLIAKQQTDKEYYIKKAVEWLERNLLKAGNKYDD